MLLGHDEGGEDRCVSIPLGGPIYVPDMVGPLTRVPEFENSVFQELQSLKEEVSGESSETCNEEILVDELKIMREDELVNKAFEEAFKQQGGQLAIDASQVTEENLSPRRADDNTASGPEHACPPNSEGDMMAIIPSEASNALPIRACRNKKANKYSSGKRKKCSRKNNSFDETYIARVEELARIKQKQEEQKADVRLHSFDGSSRVPRCGATTKADKIRSLKSSSVSTKDQ
ncbi:hypothetical protein BUALT_Bualt18G0092000 [Buddleja alternifolia]|uniref:Uncharacterized protein n=1 Tax=Buddleja alternifolia TaxID=168488 RepID=A0AAV6W4Q1_9LAMI|nr:hypothetical protein BUALT_Bualt18G0092000 [Buddleja alternifolia]